MTTKKEEIKRRRRQGSRKEDKIRANEKKEIKKSEINREDAKGKKEIMDKREKRKRR